MLLLLRDASGNQFKLEMTEHGELFLCHDDNDLVIIQPTQAMKLAIALIDVAVRRQKKAGKTNNQQKARHL